LFAWRSTLHNWKPTAEKIHILLGFFMLMDIIQKLSLQSHMSTKRMNATPDFGDILTRERLELLCKFLCFSDNESHNTYKGSPLLFKIFPSFCNSIINFMYWIHWFSTGKTQEKELNSYLTGFS
jgi:hypothetical protein